MGTDTIIKEKNAHHHASQFFSLLLSLLVHASLVLLFGATLLHLGHHEEREVPTTKTPPEVVFDLSALSEQHPVVDTLSKNRLEKAPEQAVVQSHENSAASSELPPTGETPLPTQQGREQEILSLHQENRTTGEEKTAVASTMPIPAPQQTDAQQQADSAQKTLTTSNIEATPIPAPDQPVVGHLSSRATKSDESSHPSMIRGTISNKGPASVAAEATPLGRYKKILSDAISSRWHYYVDHRIELLSFGTATISFHVTQNGKIEALELLSNSSNQSFSDCCLKSIMEAQLPEIPAEIAATLQDKKLDVEYRFTICSE
jgi:hypothetical protein